jgi:methylated-DNA-[protein]-cysteine S-methyltransferase
MSQRRDGGCPVIDLLADRVPTPIGTLLLVSDGAALHALDFEDCEPRLMAQLYGRHGAFRLRDAADPGGASGRLRAYFAGDLAALDALPADVGGTPFQREVWGALRAIPVGATLSYAALAAQLGRPAAFRAVGHANALNPVAIVVPCHRLIGSGGDLTGYSGGLHRKRWLLEHEGVRLGRVQERPAAGRGAEWALSRRAGAGP